MNAPDNQSLIPARFSSSPWTVLVVLTLGFFMILLDTTIVTIAVPHIEKGLNASFDQILWVLNAYTLVFAVLLLTAGRLGDMFGPRRMFVIGLIIFTAASAACGFSQTSGQLIIFRIVQAIGGGFLTPQTLGMLPRIFPPERRGAAFGIWGAVSGLAAVLGPVVGGLLTSSVGWQSIFFVNVPVGIITIVAALLLMPEVVSSKRERLDLVGTILASAGLFLVIFGLIEGQRFNWGPIASVGSFAIGATRWSLFSVYSAIAYGVILLALFIYYETRVQQPLLPLWIFKDRNFGVANLVGVVLSFSMAGLFIPLAIFLESILGFSAIKAGLSLVPLSLALFIAAPWAGRLADRINGKYIVIAGLSASTLGILLLTYTLSLNMSTWQMVPALVIVGLGMGATFAPLTTLSMRDIEPHVAGVASGVFNTTRQVGMAAGSAVVGAVLANSVAHDLPGQLAAAATKIPVRYRGAFGAAVRHAASGAQSYGAGQHQSLHLAAGTPPSIIALFASGLKTVFDNAFLNGLRPSLLACVAALALAAISGTLLRGGRTAAAARKVSPPLPEPDGVTIEAAAAHLEPEPVLAGHAG